MANKKVAFTPSHILFLLLALFCLTSYCSAGMALIAGMALALSVGNPFGSLTKQVTPRLLQASVVGLGAGMNLMVIGEVGLSGVGYTVVGIVLTLGLGLILGRIIKTEPNTSLLVTVGTAICGGSAIAAVASTIRAKSHEVSVALATVFFLNATALFIFPGIGHFFQLTEMQFGLLSALAIHDTSSVVGAAHQYGQNALEIATTVKLARALWIIPVSFFVGVFWNKQKKGEAAAGKRPWFILWFLVAAGIVTWVPELQQLGHWVSQIAKRALVLTLFLIGSGLSRETIKSVGIRPCIQGVILWFLMGSATLGAILIGWIQ